jgi:hypothetical protein
MGLIREATDLLEENVLGDFADTRIITGVIPYQNQRGKVIPASPVM